MFSYTKAQVNKIANDAKFNRDTTEKVLRLYSVLDFLNSGELKGLLVLKGGTAINLFLLDLPRLSVDIDLDFNLNLDKSEMLIKRGIIDRKIRDFMADEGYSLSDKSKFVHTLDSYVYSYFTTSGGRDVLKIEINYSNRVHILNPIISDSTKKLGVKSSICRLSNDELIGSKVNALIVRTTPRDIYDVYALFQNPSGVDETLIRKIAIFYICLGSEIPFDFNEVFQRALNKINKIDFRRIKETLLPVLHKSSLVDIKEITDFVSNKLKKIFILDQADLQFISSYNLKQFNPDILFTGYIVNDISKHPMAMWKTK